MNIPPLFTSLISLIMVWLIASLAVMWIHEWLASVMRWRSKMLETTIRNMLSDHALADQLYNHPLIRSLYSGEEGGTKPSYIPASQFSQALLDIIGNAASPAALIQHYLYKLRWKLVRLSSGERNEANKRLNIILALTRRAIVTHTDPNTRAAALEEIRAALIGMAQDIPNLQQSVESLLTTIETEQSQIEEGIYAEMQADSVMPHPAIQRYKNGLIALSITHPRLKQILGALLSEIINASADPESMQARARQNLEDWFNNSMDRLSGWYSRNARQVAIVVGFALALIFNVDTIHIAQTLYNNAALSAQIAQSAQAYVEQRPEGIGETSARDQLDLNDPNLQSLLALPIGWVDFQNIHRLLDGECVMSNNPRILKLIVQDYCIPVVNVPTSEGYLGWLLKLFGISLTAIATMFGAPFWFDVLKKLFNIRISGANPAELQRAPG
jgi:hypothetical protein